MLICHKIGITHSLMLSKFSKKILFSPFYPIMGATKSSFLNKKLEGALKVCQSFDFIL